MPDAVSNTSPLFYLHRIGILAWVPRLFGSVWVPSAVAQELLAGQRKGYEVPDLANCPWLRIVEPGAMPSEWLALDLGPGELATMALALENPTRIVLLDDAIARRTAQAAGLAVWGTLRLLLEAKTQGFSDRIEPLVKRLEQAGMWISAEVRARILTLAREHE
jgi:predicted nucleic acid-binding protein